MTRILTTCLAVCGLACVSWRAGGVSPLSTSSGGSCPPLAIAQAAREEGKSSREEKFYPGFSGYSRKVTTDSPEAQRWFNQGIQLLYGFNHDEAIRSFERAARADPSCAMAWWGSAYARGLHINNPEMSKEQSRLANEAAQKAVAALDNESAVEQALVRAVRQRYQWPAPKDRHPLDEKYAEAMEAVWHQFPNDPDMGALYAESLMNLQPWDLWTGDGAPKGRTLEIVAVLERTLSKAPKHPGANGCDLSAAPESRGFVPRIGKNCS